MVIQIVTVAIRPEHRERWLELIRMNAANTRTEDGCDRYQVGEDLENPNTFVVVEQWTSIEAQYDHFRQPAFQALLGSHDHVLAGPPEVFIHEVASTQTLDEALAAAGIAAEAT